MMCVAAAEDGVADCRFVVAALGGGNVDDCLRIRHRLSRNL